MKYLKKMGIVPDLRNNEWYFSGQPTEQVECIKQLDETSVLTPSQEVVLKEVIYLYFTLMGKNLV